MLIGVCQNKGFGGFYGFYHVYTNPHLGKPQSMGAFVHHCDSQLAGDSRQPGNLREVFENLRTNIKEKAMAEICDNYEIVVFAEEKYSEVM